HGSLLLVHGPVCRGCHAARAAMFVALALRPSSASSPLDCPAGVGRARGRGRDTLARHALIHHRGTTLSRHLRPPDLAGDLDHVSELAPLLVLAHNVALLGAGEAALRAQVQAVEIDVAGRLLDPALDRVLRLERRKLAADEAEHDVAVLRQEAQRLEAAGALA